MTPLTFKVFILTAQPVMTFRILVLRQVGRCQHQVERSRCSKLTACVSAYTHNWDTFFNPSLYGAFAAVHHNVDSQALICCVGAGVLLFFKGAFNFSKKLRFAIESFPHTVK